MTLGEQQLSSFIRIDIVWKPDLNPHPGPGKKRAPKKRSCWKNWTSRTENVAICYKSYERLWWNDSFSYKKQGCVKTRLHSNKVCIVYHKFLFWIRRSLYENKTCQFVAFINMEHFHMFTDFYAASFSIKISFCETNNVFYLKN